MNIKIPERRVSVPDGDRCESWDVKDRRPSCPYIRTREVYVSESDGLGSSGTMRFYSCGLFNVGLADERCVGILKCKECLKAGQ